MPVGDEGRCHRLALLFAASATSTKDWDWPMRLDAEAVKNNNKNGPMVNAQGLVYLHGQWKLAKNCFEKSRTVEPDWPARVLDWLGLAIAHHHSGDHAEAEKWWGKATTWLNKPRAPGSSS